MALVLLRAPKQPANRFTIEHWIDDQGVVRARGLTLDPDGSGETGTDG